MSVDEEFVIILAKKFGYLEKRVTYLEGKCRGQQGIIEKLQKKLRKVRKNTKSRDQRIVRNELEDSVDLKTDVDSIRMAKSNENLEGNFERCAKNDKKLKQKLIVQMGVRCEKIPLTENRAIAKGMQLRKISQTKSKTDNETKPEAKIVEISLKQKRSIKKSHVCSFCSKIFPKFSRLSDHMRIHTGERPFKCKICLKSFKHNGNLTKHSRTHTGEKPYICSTCSRAFAETSNLKKHMRFHTGERPFSCSVCSKRFAQSSNLFYHSMIHTGEKPHSCTICLKKFSRFGHLKRHEKTHGQKMST